MTQKEDSIKISQGPTLKLGLVGLLLLIGSGIITYYYSFVFAIPGFYIGLVLLLSIEGLIIDLKDQRVKHYFDFFIFKKGKWKDLKKYNKLILNIFSESSTYTLRATQTTQRTKSFDVILISLAGQQLIVKEYSDYDEALEFAEELAETLNLPFEDHFEIMQEGLAERRRLRE